MTPEALAPPFFVAAGLLALSGIAKLRHPRPIAQAMYAAGLPAASELTARLLGGVELLIGAVALTRPAPPVALAVAAAYLAFAAFLAFLIRARPGTASCGCAGERDVPPNLVHLSLNVIASMVAVAAAASTIPGLIPFTIELGWVGAPFLVGLIATGSLAAVAAFELPTALSAYRSPRHQGDAPRDRDRHRRADEALASVGIGTGHPSLWPGTTPPEEETRDE